MESSPSKNDQDTSLNESTVPGENKKSTEVRVNPEEVTGTSAGLRLTKEMLEYYDQKDKEEAAYRVYGTIPRGVDLQKFQEKMKDLKGEKWPDVLREEFRW